ncbi:MAG TPA: EamA family transporter [Haliangiales bacterium]|nr:EamA family transporter [Haliangiales bacterium]
MRPKDIALALVVVAIWGLNFVFIHIALETVPPLFLCALRFTLASVPAIFFVPRPRVPFRTLASYGLAIFTFQFGFLFSGMRAGVPAGLASLLLQTQVFFTMAASMRAFGDRPRASGWIGALVAFAGVGLVALRARGEVSAGGVVLIVLAAMSWAAGNIAAKRAGGANPFALVVWGSAIAVPPHLAASLVIEGPGAIGAAVRGFSIGLAAALVQIAYVSTILAYSLWARLLHRNSPSTVAPFTLLVPVAGFLGSVLFLGETLPPWKLAAGALVIAGLGIQVLGPRVLDAWRTLRASQSAPA